MQICLNCYTQQQKDRNLLIKHTVYTDFPKHNISLSKSQSHTKRQKVESLPSPSQAGVSDKLSNDCMQSLLQLEPVTSPGPAVSGLVSPDPMFHFNLNAKSNATLNSKNRWKHSCVLQRTSNAMSAVLPTLNTLEELKKRGKKLSSTF